MQELSAESLLRLPVLVRGIEVGRPVDVIVDIESRRALGLDVLCKDDEHRFLALSAAVVEPQSIAVSSSLTLLAADELAFYRKRARTLRGLRGAAVMLADRELGRLEDLVLATDGAVAELALTGGRRVRFHERLRIEAEPRRVDAA